MSSFEGLSVHEVFLINEAAEESKGIFYNHDDRAQLATALTKGDKGCFNVRVKMPDGTHKMCLIDTGARFSIMDKKILPEGSEKLLKPTRIRLRLAFKEIRACLGWIT